MPDIRTRARQWEPKRVPLKRWGPSWTGQPGMVVHEAFVDGRVVSECYEVSRTMHVLLEDGLELDLFAIGLGGIRTAVPFRRQGLARAVQEHALAMARQDHRHAALLFCLDEMRDHYTKQGWRVAECGVTCWNADEEPMVLPVHVHLCVQFFSPISLDDVVLIDIAGLPW